MPTDPTNDAGAATPAGPLSPANQEKTRRRPLWASLCLYLIILFVVLPVSLILWLAIAGHPGRQFTISTETTVLTAPIGRDGLVDYAAATNRRHREEVPPETNAARPLLEAVDPRSISPEMAREMYAQLDMSPLPVAGNYLVRWNDVMVASFKAAGTVAEGRERQEFLGSQLAYCREVPWSQQDAPQVAAWVAANAVPIEKVHEAAARSHYHQPIIIDRGGRRYTHILPVVDASHDLGRLLQLRGMQRLHASDSVGAWDDIHAALRLGRLLTQGDSVVEYLVGTRYFNEAVNSMATLLSSPAMTPDLLQTIERDMRQLPAWHDVAELVGTYERYVVLANIQRASRNPPDFLNSAGNMSFHAMGEEDELAENPLMVRWINVNVDWDQVLIDANACMDEAVAAFSAPDSETRGRLLDEYDRRFDELEDSAGRYSFPSTRHVAARLLPALLPALNQFNDSLARRDASDVLIETALAIERFRFDHGRIPESLAELTPEHLPSVPSDPFASGDELRYAIHGSDAYVLYSVGPNQRDDGGLTEKDDVELRIRMPTPDWLHIAPPPETEPDSDTVVAEPSQ